MQAGQYGCPCNVCGDYHVNNAKLEVGGWVGEREGGSRREGRGY